MEISRVWWNVVKYKNTVTELGCAILFLEIDISCDGKILSARYKRVTLHNKRERERESESWGEADKRGMAD